MKNSLWEALSRGACRRLGSFRPHVELLEDRAQPGSMLGLGGGVLAAAALDLSAPAALGVSSDDANQSVVHYRHQSTDDDLQLHSTPAALDVGGSTTTAPGRPSSGTLSAPVVSGSQDLNSIQSQTRAISAASQAGALRGTTLGQGRADHSNQGGSQGAAVHGPQNVTAAPQVSAMPASDIRRAIPAASFTGAHNAALSDVVVGAHSNFRQGPPPPDSQANTFYLTFLGTSDGPSQQNSVKGLADGSSIIGGSITDPTGTGTLDGYVVHLDPNGATLTGQITITSTDTSGNPLNTVVKGVDVGSDGAIYFVGTVTSTDSPPSLSELVWGRIEPDLSAIDGMMNITFPNGATADQGNGLRLIQGASGDALVLTGSLPDLNTGLDDVLLIRETNLGPDLSQAVTAGFAQGFQDTNRNPVASIGNSVTQDSLGQGWVGGSISTADLSDTSAFALIGRATYANLLNAYSFGNTTGPNLGSYLSVDADPTGGAVYLGGTTFVPNDGVNESFFSRLSYSRSLTSLYHDPSTGQQIAGWIFTPLEADGTPDTSMITGNRQIGGGQQAFVLNDFSPDPNTGALLGSPLLAAVSPNGDTFIYQQGGQSVAFFVIGLFGGDTGDDQALALDIAPDPSGVGGPDYYVVGKTNSTDLPTSGTPTPYQSSDPDPTGATYQGFAAAVQITV